MGKYYVVYITFWDKSVSKRIVLGSCKKELYAYIGYMYSNSEKIVRIDYEEKYFNDYPLEFYYIYDDGRLQTFMR